MASPEALLLRHRMHTTNICEKVIRSAFWRLFKIGHYASIFRYFSERHSPSRRGKAIHTKQFQNGTRAQRCARVHRMATPARAVGRFLVSP